jgi:protein transport protein SEC24
MGGLSSQMGGIGLGGEGAAASRPNKKKSRHAYHNIDQPTVAAQAFNQNTGNAQQYVNQDSSQQISGGHPYARQQVTPAMNQFPAQVNPPFSPGLQQQSSSPGFRNQAQAIPTPSGPGVSAQGRVDPEQIPSIARARDAATQYYLDHVYPTMEQHLPPPGAVPFVAIDQGNSSPKYARLTLNNIPSTSDSLTATGLPLGLVLQPLAPLQAGETPIPVLDFGELGPPRCRRCRAYINPFMTFRSGGNKLVCNMCTFPNDVSPEYFAPTDPTGIRVDRAQRPELTTGTVEYLVPKEYWAKPPVGLRWLFVIDVTADAVSKGFLEAFCEGIVAALYGEDEHEIDGEEPNGEIPDARRQIPAGSKVGFVTFDKAMHFYNCNVGAWLQHVDSIAHHLQENLEQAQMLVMSDVEEPFVPLGSDGLFVDPYKSKYVLYSWQCHEMSNGELSDRLSRAFLHSCLLCLHASKTRNPLCYQYSNPQCQH